MILNVIGWLFTTVIQMALSINFIDKLNNVKESKLNKLMTAIIVSIPFFLTRYMLSFNNMLSINIIMSLVILSVAGIVRSKNVQISIVGACLIYSLLFLLEGMLVRYAIDYKFIQLLIGNVNLHYKILAMTIFEFIPLYVFAELVKKEI